MKSIEQAMAQNDESGNDAMKVLAAIMGAVASDLGELPPHGPPKTSGSGHTWRR